MNSWNIIFLHDNSNPPHTFSASPLSVPPVTSFLPDFWGAVGRKEAWERGHRASSEVEQLQETCLSEYFLIRPCPSLFDLFSGYPGFPISVYLGN